MTSQAQAATASEPRCSFCSKPSSEVKRLIAGPGVNICDACVGRCSDILTAEQQKPSEPGTQQPLWEETLTEEQILAMLPRIAGQAESSLHRLVTILRERRVTWASIGAALQITRQSAWERFSGEE